MPYKKDSTPAVITPSENPLLQYLDYLIGKYENNPGNLDKKEMMHQLKNDLEKFPHITNELQRHLFSLGDIFAKTQEKKSKLDPITILQKIREKASLSSPWYNKTIYLIKPGKSGIYLEDYEKYVNCGVEAFPTKQDTLPTYSPKLESWSQAHISSTYDQIGADIVVDSKSNIAFISEKAYDILQKAYLDDVLMGVISKANK